MRWRHTIAIAAAIVVVASIAYAVVPISATSIQWTTSTSTPCTAGTSCMWVKTSDDTPYWHKADNTNTSMLGGGSTGNYTFSSDAMDLSGAAVMSIAPTTATAITLGKSTTLADGKTLTCSNNSQGTGTTTNALTLQNTTAATSGNQEYSPVLNLEGRRYSGSASQAMSWQMQTIATGNGTDSSILRFYSNVGTTQTPWIDFTNDGASSPQIRNAGAASTYVSLGNNLFLNSNGQFVLPGANGTQQFGHTTFYWDGVVTEYVANKQGAQLTAASSITPTSAQHHVTGATTISTIAVTNFTGNAVLYLIGDGGTITWDTGGNILKAGTIAQDTMQVFVYDTVATKWIPQQ